MKIPIVRGTIDRRILVNYRVDPGVLAALLPKPFRPLTVDGFGMAGVCLIRLAHLRPRHFPRQLGMGSENAAHRIAVEWEQDGQFREGVFVHRRDTSSRFNVLAGGRLFPGEHHHARIEVAEQGDDYRLVLDSDDKQLHLAVAGHVARELPTGSVFRSLDDASDFFARGSLGYSVTSRPGVYAGLELRSFKWSVQPLTIEKVESSFFEDRTRFPPGSIKFDCALLMKNIEHEWLARQSICAA
jgi:hypothetical protein